MHLIKKVAERKLCSMTKDYVNSTWIKRICLVYEAITTNIIRANENNIFSFSFQPFLNNQETRYCRDTVVSEQPLPSQFARMRFAISKPLSLREPSGKPGFNCSPAKEISSFQRDTELSVADGSHGNRQEITLYNNSPSVRTRSST